MNEVSADEIEANARLIAAAPELLNACELARKMIERRINDGLGVRIDLDALTALESSIAKARGEQS